MSNYLKLLAAVASGFLMITVSGCVLLIPGKYTAGGTLPNPASENGKATFTGHADSCNTPPSPIQFDVNYDGHDGVTLKSTSVAAAGQCVQAIGGTSFACEVCEEASNISSFGGTGNVYATDFSYESKNPRKPGTGTAVICAQDNDPNPPDFGAIVVLSGPFAPVVPYVVGGPLSGNVESHPCS